jgi:hypothetical protein
MWKDKIKFFTTAFFESTPACMLVMVQGNILLATLGHLQTAIQTGLITGGSVYFLSMFDHDWFRNQYIEALITGGICVLADFIAHPSHFGGLTTEAIVTGVFTFFISLAVNILGKKLFIHGKRKLTE